MIEISNGNSEDQAQEEWNTPTISVFSIKNTTLGHPSLGVDTVEEGGS